MKKWWKGILMCLLLLALVGVFGCDENRFVTSVSISIDEQYATQISGNMPTYSVQYSNNRIPLNISITPSSFTSRDLTFSSSDTNIAYISQDGYLVTRGEGTATLYAYYTVQSGDRHTVAVKINVFSTRVPKFKGNTYTLVYNGYDQSQDDNLQVIDGSDDYEYYYLKYNPQSDRVEQCYNLKDAGEYTIKYRNKQNHDLEVAQMSLTITPAPITVTADSITSKYLEKVDLRDRDKAYYGEASSLDTYIVSNLGEDEGINIGKYSTVTLASFNSAINTYSTDVNYSIFDEFRNNYEVTIVRGEHTIEPLDVFVVLRNYTLVYGDSLPRNMYDVYMYDDARDFTPLESQLVSTELLHSAGDVSTGDYFIYSGDNLVLENAFGNLDVNSASSPYDLNYDDIRTSRNINLVGVVSGKLIVAPRQVLIDISTPSNEYGKYHLMPDDLSSLTLSLGENAKFAREISSDISVNYGDGEWGEENRLVPAGSYSYEISGENKNFTLDLTERCKAGYEGSDKVVYMVKRAPIIASFDYLSAVYKKTASYIHTAGYYNGFDYKINMTSLTANGEDILDLKDSDFENSGFFVLGALGSSIKEKFRINTILNDITDTQTTYFRSYILSFEISFDNPQHSSNFSFTSTTSRIDLSKEQVVFSLKDSLSSSVFSGFITTPDYNSFLNDIEINSNLNVDDILQDNRGLVSLTTKNHQDRDVYYVRQDPSSDFVETTIFGNAGEYKVFTLPSDEVAFKEGMEFYDFVLDNSKEYVYKINKYDVYITPDNYNLDRKINVKTYGETDSFIRFSLDNPLPDGEIQENLLSGALVREPGENVGEYRVISLGSLSMASGGFNNYALHLSTLDNKYYISPRRLQVIPFDTVITFGQSYPARELSINDYKMRIEVGDTFVDISQFNVNSLPHLVLPSDTELKGEFKLSIDAMTPASKVGGYYPVLLDNNGQIKAYKIIFGQESDNGFRYVGHVVNGKTYFNYILEENDTKSQCIVEKKDAILSFIPSSVKDLPEGIERDGDYYLLNFNQGSSKYNITGLLDNLQYTSMDIRALFNSDGGFLYVDSVSDISISLICDTKNVAYCYNIRLASKKIYNIDSEIITVALLTLEDNLNTTTTTYDASSKGALFVPVITSTNSTHLRIKDTSIQAILNSDNIDDGGVVFTSGIYDTLSPVNSGNYVVSLKISESMPLVIESLNENEEVVSTLNFTSFASKADRYILDFSSYSFLTINKADVTLGNSDILFDGEFVYGMDRSSWPNVKLSNNGIASFVGVRGEKLYLKYNNDNHNYSVSSSTLIHTLPIGEQNIRLSVEVARYEDDFGNIVNVDGMSEEDRAELIEIVDPNYNMLELNATIDIKPRKIYIDSYSLSVNNQVKEGSIYSTIYSGSSVSCSMVLSAFIDSQITNAYESRLNVFMLKSHFEKDKCIIDGYTYDNGLLGDAISIRIEDLNQIESVEYLSSNMVVINNTYAVERLESNGIINSGIYVCEPTVIAHDNYVFVSSEIDGEARSFARSYLIEITRNTGYIKLNTPEEHSFYYGTEFRINDSQYMQDLFDITLSHSYEEYLTFVFNSTQDLLVDSILPTGNNYRITCLLDSKDARARNYYLEEELSFSVKKCKAIVTLPSTTSFIFTGEEITDFLSEISVTLVNVGGMAVTKSYIESITDGGRYQMEYEEDLGDATFAIDTNRYGEYYHLHISYEDNLYASEDEYVFVYNILPKPYSGKISCYPTLRDYEPSISFTNLYNEIRRKITIDRDMSEIERIDIFLGNVLSRSDEENALLLTIDSYEDLNSLSGVEYDERRAQLEDYLLSQIMQVTPNGVLTYKIVFLDKTIGDVYQSTNLNIRASAIKNSTIDFISSVTQMKYIGHAQYQGLAFGNIDLSPNAPINQLFSDKIYSVNTTNISVGEFVTSLYDNLGKLVITINYSYKDSSSNPIEPIMPGEYVAHYEISFGENYTGSKSVEDRRYNIVKAQYISFSVLASQMEYTGQDLLEDMIYDDYTAFIDGRNFVQITARNDDGDDVKFNVQPRRNSSDTSMSHTYPASEGISMYIAYTKANSSEILYSIRDAGDYVLYLYFNQSPSFVPQNLFECVNFNGSVNYIDAQNVKNGYVCSVAFSVRKMQINATANNIEEFINFEGDYSVIDVDGQSQLTILSTTLMNIIDSDMYTLKVYYRIGSMLGSELTDFSEKQFSEVGIEANEGSFYLFISPTLKYEGNLSSSDGIEVNVIFS